MHKNYLIFFIYLLTSFCFSQDVDSINIKQEKGQIILFGEAHFVKEKYDEMKHVIQQKINNIPPKEKVSMFFELPTSLNYAINKLQKEKDSTLFINWFDHVYKQKNKKPSFFWKDYKDFILWLIHFAKEKDIELNLKCIDRELEFRRTAYILSNFETKIGTKIDSFVNLDYIQNSTKNRTFLINYVKELSKITNNTKEIEILDQLKIALPIDCTICLKRDQFLYQTFKKYYRKTDALVFGTFGLDHVINKPDFSNVGEFFKSYHKVDTTNHKSFYNFLKDDFKNKIYRIGIIALKQDMKFSSLKKTKDYSFMMTKDERLYIENLFEDKAIIRFYPKNHNQLNNFAANLDYVIIYKSSNFK